VLAGRVSDGAAHLIASGVLGRIGVTVTKSRHSHRRGAAVSAAQGDAGTLGAASEGPGTDPPIIGKAAHLSEVMLLSQYNDEWALIRSANGEEGYCSMKHLTSM